MPNGPSHAGLRDTAAIVIQRFWRGHQARQLAKQRLQAVLRIQACWKVSASLLAGDSAPQHAGACCHVRACCQLRCAQGHLARRAFPRLRRAWRARQEAAVEIQRHVRGYLARIRYAVRPHHFYHRHKPKYRRHYLQQQKQRQQSELGWMPKPRSLLLARFWRRPHPQLLTDAARRSPGRSDGDAEGAPGQAEWPRRPPNAHADRSLRDYAATVIQCCYRCVATRATARISCPSFSR